MKILVLSDSHSSLRFMRQSIEIVRPDAVVHLGDYYDDGEAIREEYPHLRFYQVPGNCDRYRCPPFAQEMLVTRVCGVELYMTHGHRHMVKSGTDWLIRDARKCGVQAVLYGHTHIPDCRKEEGLWILNPGSCGYSATAGLIVAERNQIVGCSILNQMDLENMK